VGTVNLNVAGCFDSDANSFTGSFTMTTGSERSVVVPLVRWRSLHDPPVVTPVSDNFELTLSVTAGTGSFARATGTLQAQLDTPYNNFTNSFEGTITDFFTQILVPKAGIVSGVTILDAGAYDAPRITKVVFEVNGQVIALPPPRTTVARSVEHAHQHR